MYRIEVSLKSHLPDPRGQGLVKDIADLGIATVANARVFDVYWVDSELPADQIDLIARELFTDAVTQEYSIAAGVQVSGEAAPGIHAVEVAYNAGVTDPVEDSIWKAIRDLGTVGIKAVRTAKKYLIEGQLDDTQLALISSRLLVNPIIQHAVEQEHFAFPENPQYFFALGYVDISNADIAGQFGFTRDEFLAIQGYYRRQGRSPTDIELETLAQTWSEHCGHKTFRGKIKFNGQLIDNLLKSTIVKATRELDKPWCLSVFVDNAGVIDFDGRWALCFKVETHNHPSAVEPYGGASTGIGGVVRDPLGTGLGARPIFNTDVFCFGPPDLPYDKLPPGVLHPRRMFKGVRAGVADYGNRLGIPTGNGAILFDERYTANPLVYCGTLGLMPVNMAQRGQQKPGDKVVVVGGRTGRDGIHGVTFASEQLTGSSSEVSWTSVQIGNAIVEKKVIDVLLQAREKRLYSRITDCGGGGLSSAVGEMGADTGVRVDLEEVPLKYSGLSYTEIWISESQERMVLAVPPEHVEELLKLFAGEDVDATVIGEFTNDRHLKLFYEDQLVGDLDMEFLHNGLPQIERPAIWQPPQLTEPDFDEPEDLGKELLGILGSWNTCSKEWVIRQYDHEVQGCSVLKPLVGKHNDGPGDAAVIKPVLDSEKGVIIGNGINSRYGDIDPYWMTASVIDEALRQVIAVGGNLRRVALLDNFCWGNTARPEMLGALVRSAQACHDMSLAYGAPFISGKDSLNNEFTYEGKAIAIPHTLLISSVGVIDDVSRTISMDFKKAGDLIYLVGATYREMGGSEYYAAHSQLGAGVPRVEPKPAKVVMESLSLATEQGLVRACHDLSEGGLGVALAEMAFAGGLGAKIELQKVPVGEPITRDDYILFAESNSRFLVEVTAGNRRKFEKLMKGTSFAAIGKVDKSKFVEIKGLGDKRIKLGLAELKESWQKPLRW